MIEKAFMVLAQSVVVLIVRRRKRRAHNVELRIGGAAVVGNRGRSVFVIGNRLRPVLHFQQRLALWRAQRDMRAGRGAVEVLADVDLCLNRRMGRRQILVHGSHHSARLEDIRLRGLAGSPARRRRRCHNAISRARKRGLTTQAERHAQDILRIRLQHDGLALAVDFQPLARGLCRNESGGQSNTGEKSRHRCKPLHEHLHQYADRQERVAQMSVNRFTHAFPLKKC